jgi:hypothetical protein
MSIMQELNKFLAGLIPSLRARHQYAEVLNVEVAQEIAADIAALQSAAYAAEQADLEAAKIIGAITADGHLTDAELPLLTRALRNINRSAAHDHHLSEQLTA